MPLSNILPSVGVASSLGAIGSKACCLLPLAMAGAGAGVSSVSIVQALMPFQVPLLLLSSVLIGAGWLSYLREVRAKNDPNCECAAGPRHTSSRNVAVLSIATLLLAAAITWDWLQPGLVRLVT